MDCHGVLLWRKLWGFDEAGVNWGGLYFDNHKRAAARLGVSTR